MQTIKIEIDLSGYKPQQIIELLEQGIVTVKEVEESGAVYRFFSDLLPDYLRAASYNALDDTVISDPNDRRCA